MANPLHESHHLFDLGLLLEAVLEYRWQHECVIDPEYTIPHTGEIKCIVSYTNKNGNLVSLRAGGTSTFWDVYGDDFGSIEQALAALIHSPPPPNVDAVIPTHGLAYEPWGEGHWQRGEGQRKA